MMVDMFDFITLYPSPLLPVIISLLTALMIFFGFVMWGKHWEDEAASHYVSQETLTHIILKDDRASYWRDR